MNSTPQKLCHRFSHNHHQPKCHHGTIKTLILCALVVCLFGVIEVLCALRAQSLALLSDAGHMASDSFTLAIAALAAWLSGKPSSRRHSYGLGRAEVFAAWFSSVLLVFIAFHIGLEAITRLQHPLIVHSGMVIHIALVGLFVNLFVAWLLHRGEKTLNVRSALLHVFGDLLGSLATLISGAVIHYTQWMMIDPALSLLIAFLILYSALNLLKETMNVLMEGVPLNLNMDHIAACIKHHEQVKHINDLHVWTLHSGQIALSAHIEISHLNQWESTLQSLSDQLMLEFNITHVTVQPTAAR